MVIDGSRLPERQVIADARQVGLVSGRSLYAMDDHSRFSTLANNIIQMFKIKMISY